MICRFSDSKHTTESFGLSRTLSYLPNNTHHGRPNRRRNARTNLLLSLSRAYLTRLYQCRMQPSEVEPKDSDWVRLETTDGFTYLVKRKVALASGTMRNMLDPTSEWPFGRAKTRHVVLEAVMLTQSRRWVHGSSNADLFYEGKVRIPHAGILIVFSQESERF